MLIRVFRTKSKKRKTTSQSHESQSDVISSKHKV